MNTAAITVFQIHYRPEQSASLDPVFIPVDNAGVDDPTLELGVIKRLHQQNAAGDATYWGAVSWKFTQKTGLTGQELLEHIQSHPGYDVYHTNPSPELEALFHNMWMHGQTCHPEFLTLVDAVFTKAGLNTSVCRLLQPAETFSSANFAIATPAFWGAYVHFVDNVMQPALSDPTLREQLLSTQADPHRVHAGACYIPFIIERLFGLFLSTQAGRQFKIHKYPAPVPSARLTAHHHRLREMKDVACTTRSEWLANCWMGYRNMLLLNQRGADWARQHLPSITPASIEFGDTETP